MDVFQQQDDGGFVCSAHVATAPGARTSLFVSALNRLYVAVPRANQPERRDQGLRAGALSLGAGLVVAVHAILWCAVGASALYAAGSLLTLATPASAIQQSAVASPVRPPRRVQPPARGWLDPPDSPGFLD